MRRPPPPPGRASDGRVSPRGYHRGSAEQAPAPPERSRRDRPPTPPYDRSRQRPPARGPAPVLLRNKEVDALYELLGWVQEALEGALDRLRARGPLPAPGEPLRRWPGQCRLDARVFPTSGLP